MTNRRAWSIATDLVHMSTQEPWNDLREAIYKALIEARDSSPRFSQETVDALNDEIRCRDERIKTLEELLLGLPDGFAA
jgi:hypothetical protein